MAGPLEILLPLAISIGFTGVAFVSGSLILRDTGKSGLLVLLFLLSFYSYGHVYKALQTAGFGDPSRQWFFVLAWISVSILASILILRIRLEIRGLTNCLNVVIGILVIIPLVNIGAYALVSVTDFRDYWNKARGALLVNVSDARALPDIYYIVPDAYSSSRTLRDLGYDNSGFTDYLIERGFFVAQESYSNYMFTELSLASALNMKYLSEIEGGIPGEKRWPSFLYRNMIDDGLVINTLRSLGYTIINTRGRGLYNGESRSQIPCDRSSPARLQATNFTGALLSTTALYPVTRAFNVVEKQVWNPALCDFSVIVDVKDIEGPKFVFSHLPVPHSPYIFDRNGPKDPKSLSDTGPSDPEEYVDQVMFVDKKLKEVVDALLSGNEEPPIIIIQADHGTWSSQPKSDSEFVRVRFGILNAYYLPNEGNKLLYESISPVNTFRIIFSHYFGLDFELVADKSYYTGRPFSGSTHLDVTPLITDQPWHGIPFDWWP